MRKIFDSMLEKLSRIKAYEKFAFVIGILLIVCLSFTPENVTIYITYGGNEMPEGDTTVIYVDSGNGWNEEERHTGSIDANGKCSVSVKSYDKEISVRLDPITSQNNIEITEIEILRWGVVKDSWKGEKVGEIIDHMINADRVVIDSDAVELVPSNDDPQIYMSELFCGRLATAMQSDFAVKILLMIAWGLVFLGRLLYADPVKKMAILIWQRYRICLAVGVFGAVGSYVILTQGTMNVVINFENGDLLKYDTSEIFMDSGDGFGEDERYERGIRSDGSVSIRVKKNDEIVGIRLDPVMSENRAKLLSIQICSLGRTYASWTGAELYEDADTLAYMEEAYIDGSVLVIVPENEDPEIVLGYGFRENFVDANKYDTVRKMVLLWVLLIFGMTCVYSIRRKMLCLDRVVASESLGIVVIAIVTCLILFSDLLSGDYKFTYTSILYQMWPFSSLGVSTKGLNGADMADAMFPAIWELFEGEEINHWLGSNVFGYSFTNATYLLSPFMWLCYGITSAGQLVRYLLKDVIAIVGMYLLLRDMKCTKIAALAGGMIYIFSSAMVMWGGWPHTDVSCLAPLLFFCTNRLLEEYKERSEKMVWFFACIVLVLYVMLVAGMPPYAIYFLYLGVAYELYNMLAVHRFSWKEVGICIGIIALAVALAGFMSFAYIGDMFFSTGEYQEYRLEEAFPMYTAEPWYLLSLLIPQLGISSSSGIEYTAFSGLFLLFIIPAFFITGKRQGKNFWGFSALTILFFVFCKFSGYIFQYLPLINTSMKTRLIILFNFVVSILSALLISEMMTHMIMRKRAKIASVVWFLTVIGVIVTASCMKEEAGEYEGQIPGMIALYIIALISMLLLTFRRAKKFPAMLLFACISFSGALFAKNELQMIDSDADAMIPEPTESIAYLQETGKTYRMASIGGIKNLRPNVNVYYGIDNLCGHTMVNTRSDVKMYLEEIDSKIYDSPTMTTIKTVQNWNLLQYCGVRYLLVCEEDLADLDLDRVSHNIKYFTDGECVVELMDTQPRTYIATEAERLSDEDAILEEMIGDYEQGKIYSVDSLDTGLTATESGSSSHITEETGNHVTIEATTDGSGYLVLSDYCADGWKVYVDGKEQQILPCNYLFRAVYLDSAGEYTIEFVYDSIEKKIYWSITLVAWIVFAGLLLMHKRIIKIYSGKRKKDLEPCQTKVDE